MPRVCSVLARVIVMNARYSLPNRAARRHGKSHNRQALLALMLAGLAVAGCQSTGQQLLAEGYAPEYVEGFEAGCGSGRQAAGAMANFRKDVPRYLSQPLYAEGWRDGYRQCQAMQEASGGLSARQGSSLERQRDREWRHHVDQAKAQAYRR